MKQVRFFRKEFGEFVLSKVDIDSWKLEFGGVSSHVDNSQIYKTSKEIPVINLSKYSAVGKKVCEVRGVKPEDIRLMLPEETFEEIKRIDKETLEARVKEEMEKQVKNWEFGVGGDTWQLRIWPIEVELEYRPDLIEIREFIESHQRLFEERLMEKVHSTRPSEGFYTRDGIMYIVSNEDLMEIYNEIYEQVKKIREEKEAKEKKEIEEAIARARETGEPQVLYHYSCDCNDPNEDCDIDIVYVYVDGNGKRFTERVHTY